MDRKIIIGDTSGGKTQGSFVHDNSCSNKSIVSTVDTDLCSFSKSLNYLPNTHTYYSSVVSMYNKWALDTVKGEVYL